MDIRPIRTEADYEAALEAVSQLMSTDPDLGTKDGNDLEVLSILVETYEAEHHAIGLPEPIEAIRLRMADLGLSQRDLCARAAISPARMSEILSRNRGLSIEQVRALSRVLGLPAEVLLQPVELQRPRKTAARSGSVAPRVTYGATQVHQALKTSRHEGRAMAKASFKAVGKVLSTSRG